MEGWIGEVFSSIQGEGVYAGYRQIFVRFAGCPFRCTYCDTTEFWQTAPTYCLVERKPGSQVFKKLENPIKSEKLVKEIERLCTPDLHSISLTGGEPLAAGEFLVEVARTCKRKGWKTYLETSGSDSRVMKSAVPYLDYAAIDLKLPEHGAVGRERWASLLREELKCVRAAAQGGVKTFVKIVVLRETRTSTLVRVCQKLKSVAKVPVVLQPVTPVREGVRPPTALSLLTASAKIAELGLEVRIMPQLHRTLGVK